jgi:hypothetical protein
MAIRAGEVKRSTEFEQLVAKIVAELEPAAVVTWDDRIIGKLSGLRRQIDVSVRRTEPTFLGIIDAKDYKRRATIERIDALTGGYARRRGQLRRARVQRRVREFDPRVRETVWRFAAWST